MHTQHLAPTNLSKVYESVLARKLLGLLRSSPHLHRPAVGVAVLLLRFRNNADQQQCYGGARETHSPGGERERGCRTTNVQSRVIIITRMLQVARSFAAKTATGIIIYRSVRRDFPRTNSLQARFFNGQASCHSTIALGRWPSIYTSRSTRFRIVGRA